jgi:apolipoprotein N-acyltransferase
MLAFVLMLVALILMVISVLVEPSEKVRGVAWCFMIGSFVAQLWRF